MTETKDWESGLQTGYPDLDLHARSMGINSEFRGSPRMWGLNKFLLTLE